ncbi:MAG: hypothetical protein GQ574_17815 [Crocinitomix sp.]|nr:hypothetical protein [Crocinitomix sp.]
MNSGFIYKLQLDAETDVSNLEMHNVQGFTIYPNPTTDAFTIDFGTNYLFRRKVKQTNFSD